MRLRSAKDQKIGNYNQIVFLWMYGSMMNAKWQGEPWKMQAKRRWEEEYKFIEADTKKEKRWVHAN